ncbi:MAG TPA: T9SS type A sorting domain-containing protein, partial [Bacteroidetes bacterium]|nr:T9SS type A sorting domain-containing protein [Bacteroidota bacterium]
GFKVKGISLNANEEDGYAETNVEGEYYLNGLEAYDKYEIVPDKDDTPLDGLSTLDLVLIQKHLLGIKNFDNPYSYIASDANNNHSISATDLLELRKLILGIYQQLPSNESWKFINADTEFENPHNPWDYEENYITDSLMYELDSIDFIAIKIGDINRSASIYNGNNGIEERNEDTEYLIANNTIFSNQEEVSFDLKAENNEIITGFQFTLEFDPAILEFVGVENKAVDLIKSNINTLKKSEGLIMISWNNASGTNVNENESLLKFNFKSRSSGILKDAVKISSQITKAEIYNDELETSKLELRFEGEDYSGLKVYQNTPNPFSKITEIVFDLPQNDDVDIKIIDSTGKILLNNHRHYSKGQNSIKISSEDLTKSGIYFYKITTSKSSVVKRMILIK